jgi:hypothetical protein
MAGQFVLMSDHAVAHRGRPAEALGRGFLSTLGRPMGLLVDPDDPKNRFETEDEYEKPFSFRLVDDRSSFAEMMAADINAKFGFSGGGASFRASMSHSFRKSERSLVLILNRLVKTQKQFLRDPHWRQEAIGQIKNSEAFIQRYGDFFVKTVHLGGLVSLVYTLNFSDMEEASKFEASFDAKFGGSGGGADFQQNMLRTATATSIFVEGICSGVLKSPNIFTHEQGIDKGSGKIDAHDKLADALIRYFDDFDTRVQADGVPIAVYLETDSSYTCANAPSKPRIDLSDFKHALEDAAALDNEIDDRLSKANYMNDVAHLWNLAPLEKIADMREKLGKLQRELRKAADDIAHHKPQKPQLPFSKGAIPGWPDSWVPRKLRPVEGYPFSGRDVIVGDGTFQRSIAIPRLSVGAPLKIILQVIFTKLWSSSQPLSGSIVSSVKKSDGSGTKLLPDVPLIGSGHSDQEKIIPYENGMEAIEINITAKNAELAITQLNLLSPYG